MEVIKGADVAQKLAEELKHEVEDMKKRDVFPCAAVVRVGENPSCIAYGNGATKKLESIGIKTEHYVFPENITQEDFMEEFRALNEAPHIHGILLLRPLPPQLDEKTIGEATNPLKDVDTINPLNMYKVMVGDDTAFAPCTPEAVMRIIDYAGIELTGKRVTIVGASRVVGLPLFLLMLNRNATCTQCHIYTRNLAEECRRAEIVVAAAGKRGLIRREHIAEGATVIDVGINVDAEGKLHGDVDFEQVEPLAEYITPVPGGVGSVTTTVLASHVVRAAKMLNGF